MQSDPVGLNGGINAYVYSRENPLINIDPYGLIDVRGFLIRTAVSTGLNQLGGLIFGFPLVGAGLILQDGGLGDGTLDGACSNNPSGPGCNQEPEVPEDDLFDC